MDAILCDELMEEIFRRLPPPSAAAASLVSKRWRRLVRSSTTSLSIHVSEDTYQPPATVSSLSALLEQHPFLSSLSIFSSIRGSDRLLRAVACCCPQVRHVSFLGSPVSFPSLRTLAASCVGLSSLSLSVARPLNLSWLRWFKSLKSLGVYVMKSQSDAGVFTWPEIEEAGDGLDEVGLSLESLTLSGVKSEDAGIGHLWRNCRNVGKLRLESCESFADYSSAQGFFRLLSTVDELELLRCRAIVGVLSLRLAETHVSLTSLLIHDGGCGEGLLRFASQSRCALRSLDLRLPLDLKNSHLIAFSENPHFRDLTSLRLESCCLGSGEGLKSLSRAVGHGLEELALVNCDVLEKEPGLLATLGQGLRGRLRKLDLSMNKMLQEKEVVLLLMGSSCGGLLELRLRGCARLGHSAVYAVVRCCKELREVDVVGCGGVGEEGVEFLVMKGLRLRRLEVEGSKVSEVAKMEAFNRFIEIVS